MNKFISFALVLFATVAIACAAPYGPPAATYGQVPAGPPVQQVGLETLGLSNLNLAQYLDGAAPAANYGSKQVVAGYVPVSNIATAPAPSQASGYNNAPAAGYNNAPALGYNNAPIASGYNAPAQVAPASNYGAPASNYGAPAPKYISQPAYSSNIYPGQLNYKAYQSPPSYSRVALPVTASDAVAKLFIQQKQAYAPANNYGSGSTY